MPVHLGEQTLDQPRFVEVALDSGKPVLEILLSTVQDLTSTLSTDEVIRRLLQRVMLHLDSEIASILLLGRDGMLRITHSEGLPQEGSRDHLRSARSRNLRSHGETRRVAVGGRRRAASSVSDGAIMSATTRTRRSVCHLLNRGEVTGVINVNNKRNREPYSFTDLKLVEAMAGHAAVALANACTFEETLERARTDALTGLANHGYFWTTLEAEMARARRYGRGLSLAMLDADYFKAYNDRHGHRAGDEALARIAHIIRDTFSVARYAGALRRGGICDYSARDTALGCDGVRREDSPGG